MFQNDIDVDNEIFQTQVTQNPNSDSPDTVQRHLSSLRNRPELRNAKSIEVDHILERDLDSLGSEQLSLRDSGFGRPKQAKVVELNSDLGELVNKLNDYSAVQAAVKRQLNNDSKLQSIRDPSAMAPTVHISPDMHQNDEPERQEHGVQANLTTNQTNRESSPGKHDSQGFDMSYQNVQNKNYNNLAIRSFSKRETQPSNAKSGGAYRYNKASKLGNYEKRQNTRVQQCMKQINRDSREIENLMRNKRKSYNGPLNQDIDHLGSFHFPEQQMKKQAFRGQSQNLKRRGVQYNANQYQPNSNIEVQKANLAELVINQAMNTNYHNALTTYKIQKILNLNEQIVNLNLLQPQVMKTANRSPRMSQRKSWLRSKTHTSQVSSRRMAYNQVTHADMKIDTTQRQKEESQEPKTGLLSSHQHPQTHRLETPLEEMYDSLREMEQSMRIVDDNENENHRKPQVPITPDDGCHQIVSDTLGHTQYRLDTEGEMELRRNSQTNTIRDGSETDNYQSCQSPLKLHPLQSQVTFKKTDMSTGINPADKSQEFIKSILPNAKQSTFTNVHAVSPFLKSLKPVKQFNQLSLTSMGHKQHLLEEIEEEKKGQQLTIVDQEAMESLPQNTSSMTQHKETRQSSQLKAKNTSLHQTIKSQISEQPSNLEQTFKFESKFDKHADVEMKIKHQTGSEIQNFKMKKNEKKTQESGQYDFNEFNSTVSPKFQNPLTILKFNQPDANNIHNLIDNNNPVQASYLIISPNIENSNGNNIDGSHEINSHIDTQRGPVSPKLHEFRKRNTRQTSSNACSPGIRNNYEDIGTEGLKTLMSSQQSPKLGRHSKPYLQNKNIKVKIEVSLDLQNKKDTYRSMDEIKLSVDNEENRFGVRESVVDSEPTSLNLKIRKTAFPEWTKQGRKFKKTKLSQDKNEMNFQERINQLCGQIDDKVWSSTPNSILNSPRLKHKSANETNFTSLQKREKQNKKSLSKDKRHQGQYISSNLPPEAQKIMKRVPDNSHIKEFSRKVYNQNRDRYLNKLSQTQSVQPQVPKPQNKQTNQNFLSMVLSNQNSSIPQAYTKQIVHQELAVDPKMNLLNLHPEDVIFEQIRQALICMDEDQTLEQKLEDTFSSKVVTSPRDLPTNMLSGRYSKRSTTHHDKKTFLADIPNVIKERQTMLETTKKMIDSHRLIPTNDELVNLTTPGSVLRQKLLRNINSKIGIENSILQVLNKVVAIQCDTPSRMNLSSQFPRSQLAHSPQTTKGLKPVDFQRLRNSQHFGSLDYEPNFLLSPNGGIVNQSSMFPTFLKQTRDHHRNFKNQANYQKQRLRADQIASQQIEKPVSQWAQRHQRSML